MENLPSAYCLLLTAVCLLPTADCFSVGQIYSLIKIMILTAATLCS